MHEIREIQPSPKLSIVYISLNEVDLLLCAVEHFSQLGQEVQIFMDSRTEESELSKLSEAGLQYRILVNEYPFVEGVIEDLCRQAGTEWVWILNGDEIPSREALIQAHKFVDSAAKDVHCVGVPRTWIRRIQNGGFEKSRARFIGDDYQWRIVRTNSVKFIKKIHTPGFVVNPEHALKMPKNAVVYHVDWIAHTYELRKRKLEKYEATMPGASKYFRLWYLPELNERKHRFVPVKSEELGRYAEKVHGVQSAHGWVDRI